MNPPEVCWREDRRARRMQLRLSVAERCVVLTVPPGVARRRAERFLLAQRGWIVARLAGLPPAIPFAPGVVLPLCDRRLTLASGGARAVERVEDELRVRGEGALFAGRVRRWLKGAAEARLGDEARAMAARAGLTVRSVRVGDTRSRWGSCSAAGVLRFSWRLVLAPGAVRRAIVAHEVAHLREMHHGPAFWRLAGAILAENGGAGLAGHRAAHRWLAANGALLHAYGAEGRIGNVTEPAD